MPHCHLCGVEVECGRVCAPKHELALWVDPITVENCTHFLIKMQERPPRTRRFNELLSTSDAFKTLMRRTASDPPLVRFYLADDVVQGRYPAETTGESR